GRTWAAARLADFESELADVVARERKPLARRQRDRRRRARGANRQLAAAAVDEHRQRDARRPAEVVELVDGGTDRPPGIEHVVDEHDVPALDLERQPGVVGAAREAAL